MRAQDSNRVDAPDSRHPTMSVLNTQRSLQDSKLAGSYVLPNEIRFYGAKLKLKQFKGTKGLIRKM
jgi:hypothetical protein